MSSTDDTTKTTSQSTSQSTSYKPVILSWESYTREQALGCPENMRENPSAVIRDLEKRQESVVKEVITSKKPLADSTDKLLGFMSNGAEEFKARTGRNMTYAEMRAAWG